MLPTLALKTPAPLSAVLRCRGCGARLMADDPQQQQICRSCEAHPVGRRLGDPPATPVAGARDFTAADLSMIRRLRAVLPPGELLALLNERLAADLGPDATPYTPLQLQAVLDEAAAPADASTWAGLRRLLNDARRQGTLEDLTRETIDDFGLIFRLTPAQVDRLCDVLFGDL